MANGSPVWSREAEVPGNQFTSLCAISSIPSFSPNRGLPLCNTLLRVFRAEIDWPVVACYDVASLATTFCWKEDDSGFWIGLGAGSVTSLLFTPLF